MQVKVQCPCGTKFAFDVEPMNGRMPMPVNCPACGADSTELANAQIREQLAAPPPAAKPQVRIHVNTPAPSAPSAAVSAPPPPPSPPTPVRPAPPSGTPAAPAPPSNEKPGLRLHAAKPQSSAGSGEDASGGQRCSKHANNEAVEKCFVCGKPICLTCMEMFGYLCSVYCRTQAERQKLDVPVYAHQRSVVESKARSRVKLITAGALSLVLMLLGAWIWYEFHGSRPRVVFSESIAKGDRVRHYELLGPDQLLLLKKSEMSLFHLGEKKQLWSVTLKSTRASEGTLASRSQISSRRTASDDDDDDSDDGSPYLARLDDPQYYSGPRVLAATNSIWLLYPERIDRHDLVTGAHQQEIPIPNPVMRRMQTDESIVMISGDTFGRRTVTHITLADGKVRTEQVEPRKTETIATVKKPGAAPGQRQSLVKTATGPLNASADDEPEWERFREEIHPAGTDVVQMQVQLLERIKIAHQAMKQQSKPALDGPVSAGRSLEVAQDLLNEMRREDTGGMVEEDVSRYEVTLRRLLAQDAPAWTGEVIGPPDFFTAKTVDILASGKAIYVFDRNNKKLWESKLTYPMAARYSWFDDGVAPPCVEVGNTLYVADAGMLTAHDLASGEVRWRLTSVGISKLQLDPKGNLYINTTDAGPDALQYSQQINIFSKTSPVLLKVDPETGKVLWRADFIADNSFMSGKYIYATRTGMDRLSAVLNPFDETPVHFHLYRVNPSNGKQMWDYYQKRAPARIDAHGNTILLHFRSELQVLRYLSL